MNEIKKFEIQFTKREASIILSALAGYLPPKNDEMISIMLYNRIVKKIEENA